MKYPIKQTYGLAKPGDVIYINDITSSEASIVSGYYLLTKYQDITRYVFGQTERETYKFGTIEAKTDLKPQIIADLRPHENHIYQTYMSILGPGQYYQYQPENTILGGIDNIKLPGSKYRELSYLDQFNCPPYMESEFNEFWWTDRYPPTFAIYNPLDRPIKPEVSFEGRMFDYKKMTSDEVSERDLARVGFRYIQIGNLEKLTPRRN